MFTIISRTYKTVCRNIRLVNLADVFVPYENSYQWMHVCIFILFIHYTYIYQYNNYIYIRRNRHKKIKNMMIHSL